MQTSHDWTWKRNWASPAQLKYFVALLQLRLKVAVLGKRVKWQIPPFSHSLCNHLAGSRWWRCFGWHRMVLFQCQGQGCFSVSNKSLPWNWKQVVCFWREWLKETVISAYYPFTNLDKFMVTIWHKYTRKVVVVVQVRRPWFLSGLFNTRSLYFFLYRRTYPQTQLITNKLHSYYFICTFTAWLDIHLDSFFTCTCTSCSTPVLCLTATIEKLFILLFAGFILMQFIYSTAYLKFKLHI